MFLKRFIYVNWGNLPNSEFDFGPVNLFSGGNGSGKTTAADAIQTVMTAAHENLFQFNPGQDETTQRGRGGKRVRTLASYVLGCDDGSFSRLDPSDGYLAAVFHPTQGESAEPFTALIAVRAWLEQGGSQAVARQQEAAFFILPCVELTLGHLQREDKGGAYVTPLDHLPGHLATEFGRRAVERYDTKKGYLRRLYAVLRGRDDQVTEHEAVAAARAFSRFMAYKPVSSINQFVAEEILERRDLGEAIRTVAAQLKTIHAMEREANALVEGIALLEQGGSHAQRYIECWLQLATLDYTLARHEALSRQQDYLNAHHEQQRLAQRTAELEEELALTHQERERCHEERVQLEAQRQGVDTLRHKDELQRQQQGLQARLRELGRQLQQQERQLQHNQTQLQTLSQTVMRVQADEGRDGLIDKPLRELLQQATDQGAKAGLSLERLQQLDLTGDPAALEQHLAHSHETQRLHNRLYQQWHEPAQGERNRRERLQARLAEQRRQLDTLQGQLRQKQAEVERLQAHQVAYPPYVERALGAIREQCPQADPRVLCDHVEVRDAHWQAAIEGYLGGARFNILVEQQHEAEAIRIVRALPGRDNRARVVQGHKAAQDAARIELERDSIIHTLHFSHAIARDYLIASYGSVQRVDSAEALRHTRRGLTAEGMGSGSYALFRCDLGDGELVFGAAARERALGARQAELAPLEAQRQEAAAQLAEGERFLAAVEALTPLGHADTLAEILSLQRELPRLQGLLDGLELGQHQALDERLGALRQRYAELEQRLAQLHVDQGKVGEQQGQAARATTALSALQEQAALRAEGCEAQLHTLQGLWPAFAAQPCLDQADAEAADCEPRALRERHAVVERELHRAERELDEAIQAHNRHCRPGDAVYYHGFEGDYDNTLFGAIIAVRQELDRVYNLLKNNILVDKHGELQRLKESFNSTFVTHLCHQIHQAIRDGERQIELLNRELQHHRFGADRETFRFASEWVPEYRDYARFFEEVMRIPSLGEETLLFTTELSARSTRVRDELMRLLLEEDEQRALRELERIADYRNYRRYEIYKEVEGKLPIPLSEYGTGSGGQLETPAYIIRAAAITSAFRFAEGQNHLRMVLVDEAFMHMDEQRSREVIGYLTDTLGLQLIFIMPTSKCGPFMDLISNEFIFAKVPSTLPRGQLHTRVLVDRRVGNRERISELWAQHRRSIYQQAELDFMEDVLAG